jgi:murein L,D-transpeptidase YcbB/YkuD
VCQKEQDLSFRPIGQRLRLTVALITLAGIAPALAQQQPRMPPALSFANPGSPAPGTGGPVSPATTPQASQPAPAGAIPALLAQGDSGPLADIHLDIKTLDAFYATRNGHPAWIDASGAPTPTALAALQMIGQASAEGLNPQAYRLDRLQGLAKPATPDQAAQFDVLLSDSLARYSHDLATGRTPIGVERDETFTDTVNKGAALAAMAPMPPDGLQNYLEGLKPTEPDYKLLKQALVDLRARQASGGWPELPDGPSVKPGMSDSVVPQLRARLGLPPADKKVERVYDDQVVGAVKAFQETHAIKDDGALGHDTRAALNMPVDARIAEVIAAMERWRWLPHDLGPRYVMDDVGGFWTRYVDNGQLIMQLPVIVGTTERETPLLISEIQQAVVNPTWTVPPTIIRKDILPKLRADPDYLEKRGINLYRKTDDGLEKISAAGYDGGSEYVLRQPAGDKNPLGRFKLLFPNRFSIYMHDTDEQKKFGAALRTFSSGCIRVENVRRLFEALLQGQTTPEQIDDYLASGDTKTIRLQRPLPVYIDYFSVWFDPQGHIIFGPDLYNKDVQLAAELQAP